MYDTVMYFAELFQSTNHFASFLFACNFWKFMINSERRCYNFKTWQVLFVMLLVYSYLLHPWLHVDDGTIR